MGCSYLKISCYTIKIFHKCHMTGELLTDGPQFTAKKLDKLYVPAILVSPAHKTTCHDMTCTVLKVT